MIHIQGNLGIQRFHLHLQGQWRNLIPWQEMMQLWEATISIAPFLRRYVTSFLSHCSWVYRMRMKMAWCFQVHISSKGRKEYQKIVKKPLEKVKSLMCTNKERKKNHLFVVLVENFVHLGKYTKLWLQPQCVSKTLLIKGRLPLSIANIKTKIGWNNSLSSLFKKANILFSS